VYTVPSYKLLVYTMHAQLMRDIGYGTLKVIMIAKMCDRSPNYYIGC